MGLQTKVILMGCLALVGVFIVLWDKASAQKNPDQGPDIADLSKDPGAGSGGSGSAAGIVGGGTEPAIAVSNPGSGSELTGAGTVTEVGPDTMTFSAGGGESGKGSGDGRTRTGLPDEGSVTARPGEGAGSTGPGDGGGRVEPEEKPIDAPQVSIYKVKSGDTPTKIAKKLYQDGNLWRRIIDANRDKINAGGTNLEVGMELIIPPIEGKPPVRIERDTPPAGIIREPAGNGSVGAGKSQEYVVQPGDSLSAISDQFYGTSARWNEIFEANTDKLSSPDDLKVGETITIPPAK